VYGSTLDEVWRVLKYGSPRTLGLRSIVERPAQRIEHTPQELAAHGQRWKPPCGRRAFASAHARGAVEEYDAGVRGGQLVGEAEGPRVERHQLLGPDVGQTDDARNPVGRLNDGTAQPHGTSKVEIDGAGESLLEREVRHH
jgi:hypothetical protein